MDSFEEGSCPFNFTFTLQHANTCKGRYMYSVCMYMYMWYSICTVQYTCMCIVIAHEYRYAAVGGDDFL